ncbi:MAG: thioredoxin [Verrucomicrobia bacterium]|nr:thioredoxin [Verrucomicrobiota bacterium]
MKRVLLLVAVLLSSWGIMAQGQKVNWVSFEEAVKLNEKEPRKFIIDVYTDWCGWCKRMDQTTFKDPVVIKYINDKYWAVKLNAERKDTVWLGEQMFINENPKGKRSAHQLAIALLNGKMSYPTVVYLDENVDLLSKVPGYVDAQTIAPILRWFGENVYLNTSFEDYKSALKSND